MNPPNPSAPPAPDISGALLDGEKRMLELIAQGAPLEQVLEVPCHTVEAHLGPSALTSVLLLDAGGRLRHAAGPSLPPAYCAAIDGVAIGPSVGSCGTAAYLRELVVASDIATDERWRDYAQLAAAHGLRACWSMPIQGTHGRVLGTFAIYYRQPRAPTGDDLRLIQRLALTARVAIERDAADRERSRLVEQARRAQAEAEAEREKFRALFDSMPQLGWTARPDGFIDFYNHGWYEYTGTTPEQTQGWGWTSVHDPAVLPAVMERWQHSLATGTPFEMEFPLRRHDGVFRRFLTRVSPMRDAQGSVTRWVGINTDVDDIRAARALGEEVAAQSRDVEALLRQLVDAKSAAERRLAELEAAGGR